jgi:beta-lactamase superfamily II metal-dependent hydrolase
MPPIRSTLAILLAATLTSLPAVPAGAVTPNGRLQIIHLDVGQGDGAVIITPLGQVVMIDDGVGGNPTPASGVKVPAQLQALGVTHVDAHFCSHYHADHLGLFKTIFDATTGIATVDVGWDRGGSYTTSYYSNYESTLGAKRRTLTKGQVITFDSLSAHPVTVKCVDLNGAGISTTDENSLSVQLKVSYGEFDMSFGGDTPGQNSGSYKNVETTVGPEMGPIEVYKVHHHGSATSSLTDWLNATHPKIAVVSEGNGNSYGHPTASAMSRLHSAGVHVYWTETGAGAPPDPNWDKVSNGQIVISATWQPGGVDTIRGNGFADTFTNSGSATDQQAPLVTLGSPAGGETWKAGSAHAIAWTASDNVGVSGVDLAYSTDGGASFPNAIATGLANTGSYGWTVPDVPGTALRVRVVARDAAGNAGRDSSAADFTVDTWTIAASAGPGGELSPSGAVGVVQGGSEHFSIAPSAGYQVATLLVDGVAVTPDTSYTFADVTADHTLEVTFTEATAGVGAGSGAVLALGRPQPNPGRGSTLLRFALPAAGAVRLEIVDPTGRRRWQVGADLGAGPHVWRWEGQGSDGSPLGSGLYFVRLITPWGERTERLVWLR